MPKSERDIIVYCTTWCPDCQTTKRILNQNGVIFTAKDIEADPVAEKEFLELIQGGPHSVPRILIRDLSHDPSLSPKVLATLIEPSPEQLLTTLQNFKFIKTDNVR